MDAEWQQTLIDSTPTQYRERGFIVYLDTTVTPNVYETGDYDTSQWVFPGDNIYWFWDALIEPDPFANATGARYPVARFHTHTPEEFANANFLKRDTGPLLEDEPTAIAEKTPGFVYDYIDSPIFRGHAETNFSMVYPYGPEKKELLQ